MPLDLKNLADIRQATGWNPDIAAKLAELIQSMGTGVNNLEQQTNGNTQGAPQPPGAINELTVNGANGHYAVAIKDENPIYRGISYFVEHDTDPNFSNPQIEEIGASRNKSLFLGEGQRYFRAYSSYRNSAPSPAVYHGSQATPLPVIGGGSVGPPPAATSQGSGTGAAGAGLQGPGKVPFRSDTGVPPTR